jgi:hypothetical protein
VHIRTDNSMSSDTDMQQTASLRSIHDLAVYVCCDSDDLNDIYDIFDLDVIASNLD